MSEATTQSETEAAESQQASAPPPDSPESGGSVEVHEAEPPEATEAGGQGPGGQIDILLDTTMHIAARLGQAELKVRDLLQMNAGSVLTLDKQVGEPVELFLRGIKFATGTLVVVGEQLGVRIKEILSPEAVEKDAPS